MWKPFIATCGGRREFLRSLGMGTISLALANSSSGAEAKPLRGWFPVAVGTPLFDNCDLEAAAEQAAKLRRSTFCMMVEPLRVPGATGSPFNPLAPF